MSDAPIVPTPAPKKKKIRKIKYVKKSGVYATPVGLTVSSSGQTRKSVIQAAQVFGDQARKSAARFSTRIPAATRVEGAAEQEAAVVVDGNAAPNAAPFEFGERHPLWGRRGPGDWRKQPTRAFLSNAAKNPGAINRAVEAYGAAEALMLAEEYGYTE